MPCDPRCIKTFILGYRVIDVEGKNIQAPHSARMPGCLALLLPEPNASVESLFAQLMWLKTWLPGRAWIVAPRPLLMDDELRLRIVEQVEDRTGPRILASASMVVHWSKRKKSRACSRRRGGRWLAIVGRRIQTPPLFCSRIMRGCAASSWHGCSGSGPARSPAGFPRSPFPRTGSAMRGSCTSPPPAFHRADESSG